MNDPVGYPHCYPQDIQEFLKHDLHRAGQERFGSFSVSKFLPFDKFYDQEREAINDLYRRDIHL